MKNIKKLLFITRITPTVGSGGAHAYSNSLLEFFHDSGYKIHVLLLEPCILKKRIPWVYHTIPGTHFEQLCPGYFRIGAKLWSFKGMLCSMLNKLSVFFKMRILDLGPIPPAPWGYNLSLEEQRWVKSVAESAHWDLVICNYCWISEAFRYFQSNTCKAILTHDVWHQHVLRKSSNHFFKELNAFKELKYLQTANIVIAICNLDAKIFSELDSQLNVITAPMALKPRFSDYPPDIGSLLFVGSNYKPNIDGINWFISEVGPILESKMPRAFCLSLIGAVSKLANISPAYNIQVLRKGFVADLKSEYMKASIVVVPILEGTGLKIKLVEAIAHGKAIVTTSQGARGLEKFEGKAFCVANSAEDMAAMIIRLNCDNHHRRMLETTARQVARDSISQTACYGELLSQISDNSPS